MEEYVAIKNQVTKQGSMTWEIDLNNAKWKSEIIS